MYDEVKPQYSEKNMAKSAPKEVEALRIIEQIKDELFRTREVLRPVIQNNVPKSVQDTSPSGNTPLLQELLSLLEIARLLKEDIYM